MNGFPQRIEIELSSVCNLSCVYCPRKFIDGEQGLMSLSLFKKIIDQAADYKDTVIVLHRRGESLLHPDFLKICDYVKGKFKELQLATNATLLEEKRSKAIIETLDFISFSIDAPGTFELTRSGANYPDVEARIMDFLSLNAGRVRTQVSMVASEKTLASDVEAFKSLWKGKVDRIRIYEEHSSDGKFGSLKKARPQRLPCVMPSYELLVFSNGLIGRCNHDWGGGMSLGDANASSIKDIWNGEAFQNLRLQHERVKITDDICKNCDSWYPSIGRQGTGEVLE